KKRCSDGKQFFDWVQEQRRKHPRMGGRKLYQRQKSKMVEAGIKMGRDSLFELLRRYLLLVRPRRSQKLHTAKDTFTRWTNKLAGRNVNRPNQAWVADITYLRTRDGFCYLALISDKYSRKILGWDVAESLELEGALRALKQAL